MFNDRKGPVAFDSSRMLRMAESIHSTTLVKKTWPHPKGWLIDREDGNHILYYFRIQEILKMGTPFSYNQQIKGWDGSNIFLWHMVELFG